MTYTVWKYIYNDSRYIRRCCHYYITLTLAQDGILPDDLAAGIAGAGPSQPAQPELVALGGLKHGLRGYEPQGVVISKVASECRPPPPPAARPHPISKVASECRPHPTPPPPRLPSHCVWKLRSGTR